MNDAGIDLKGKTVIVRNPPGTKKKFSVKERTFKITGEAAATLSQLGHVS